MSAAVAAWIVEEALHETRGCVPLSCHKPLPASHRVTLRRVALFLEQYGYEAYLVGRPFVPLNFGHWHAAYEAAALPCPPYCTGDVVALRRDWPCLKARSCRA